EIIGPPDDSQFRQGAQPPAGTALRPVAPALRLLGDDARQARQVVAGDVQIRAFGEAAIDALLGGPHGAEQRLGRRVDQDAAAFCHCPSTSTSPKPGPSLLRPVYQAPSSSPPCGRSPPSTPRSQPPVPATGKS